MADIDEADLSVSMGLQITLFDAVSMESFAFQADQESKVLPSYHMMLSVAAFPSIPLFPKTNGEQHDHLADNVPEELTRFIWMNFGSVPFDERLIGGTAMASGIEPCTVLKIGDSEYLTDHHPNEMSF